MDRETDAADRKHLIHSGGSPVVIQDYNRRYQKLSGATILSSRRNQWFDFDGALVGRSVQDPGDLNIGRKTIAGGSLHHVPRLSHQPSSLIWEISARSDRITLGLQEKRSPEELWRRHSLH